MLFLQACCLCICTGLNCTSKLWNFIIGWCSAWYQCEPVSCVVWSPDRFIMPACGSNTRGQTHMRSCYWGPVSSLLSTQCVLHQYFDNSNIVLPMATMSLRADPFSHNLMFHLSSLDCNLSTWHLMGSRVAVWTTHNRGFGMNFSFQPHQMPAPLRLIIHYSSIVFQSWLISKPSPPNYYLLLAPPCLLSKLVTFKPYSIHWFPQW